MAFANYQERGCVSPGDGILALEFTTENHMTSPLLPLAGMAVVATPVSAVQDLGMSFPMEVISNDVSAQETFMAPDRARILGLTMVDQVALADVPLPTGELVELQLERIDLGRLGLGFFVDGEARPDLLEGLDLSLWKGTVVGEANSEVRLSFSSFGSRGWIKHGDELIHLSASPDEDGGWFESIVVATTESRLRRDGEVLGQFCGVETNAAGLESDIDPRWITTMDPNDPGPGTSSLLGTNACDVRGCAIAVETDFQLFQIFNDLPAETAYIATLLGFISDRYEEQVNTVLTFPYVGFYTDANDPWTTQDTGGPASDLIGEFRGAWAGQIPMNAALGHFISGASISGGYAYVNVLGNPNTGFAVSGNISGNVRFPVMQQPMNWDFIVISHELGHNFSAPHTHDLCPPIDECAMPGFFGACQTQWICESTGTLMSYCYQCHGGTVNVTTYFHPEMAARMRSASEQDLPLLHGSFVGEDLRVVGQGSSTPIIAQVSGTSGIDEITGIDLNYRYHSGTYETIAMIDQGGGLFSAELPPAICTDRPEYYFSAINSGCGLDTDPPDAPTNTYSAAVGVATPLFDDDFESDLGWTVEDLGATAGQWRRRVPSDDPSSTYDPAADYDGSRKCYVTGAGQGGVDVDDGAVRLVSPSFDTTGGAISVQYAYYLGLSDPGGTDVLRVEWSSNDMFGPWIEIAIHDTNSEHWRSHVITSAMLVAAGVSLSDETRLRFTANDGGAPSTVEAGLDAFSLLSVDCFGGGAVTYCATSPSSASSGAVIISFGSVSLLSNNFTLAAGAGVPDSPGLFYYGSTQVQTPFGDGLRCVGGATQRLYPIQAASETGTTIRQLDFSLPPLSEGPRMITVGSTWNFQYWFRDGAAGKSGFNLSNGLSVTFAP